MRNWDCLHTNVTVRLPFIQTCGDSGDDDCNCDHLCLDHGHHDRGRRDEYDGSNMALGPGGSVEGGGRDTSVAAVEAAAVGVDMDYSHAPSYSSRTEAAAAAAAAGSREMMMPGAASAILRTSCCVLDFPAGSHWYVHTPAAAPAAAVGGFDTNAAAVDPRILFVLAAASSKLKWLSSVSALASQRGDTHLSFHVYCSGTRRIVAPRSLQCSR